MSDDSWTLMDTSGPYAKGRHITIIGPPVGSEERVMRVSDHKARVKRLEEGLARAVKQIQAQHRHLVSLGGAPCSCEYCKSEDT